MLRPHGNRKCGSSTEEKRTDRHVYIPEFKADFHGIVPLHSGPSLYLYSTSMFLLRRRRHVAQSVGVDDKTVSSCHPCSVWITKSKTMLIMASGEENKSQSKQKQKYRRFPTVVFVGTCSQLPPHLDFQVSMIFYHSRSIYVCFDTFYLEIYILLFYKGLGLELPSGIMVSLCGFY